MTWLMRLRTRAIGKSGQLTLNAGKLFDQLSKILADRYGSLAGGTAQASQGDLGAPVSKHYANN
jgi:hypothetical protein